MIRNWIKTRAAGALCKMRMDEVIGSWMGARAIPLVIGYHRVVEDFAPHAETSIPSMLVSRRMLEQHLDCIGRRYRFVDLNELGARLESGSGGSDPIAAVTFDDGYGDFYDHALPVLQKKGIPAAVFVVSGLVGTKRLQAHDRIYLLLARRFRRRMMQGVVSTTVTFPVPGIDAMTPYRATRTLLEALPSAALEQLIQALEAEDPIDEDACQPLQALTWERLDAIHRAGIRIGSHTRSHVLMTKESRARVQDELTGSREELEQRLGTSILHIAYPSGLWDTSAVHAAASAGYRFGFAGCMHRDSRHPLLTIPRVMLWQNACLDSHQAFSEPLLRCQVHRAFDVVTRCRQRHKAGGRV
jgi:peptidoglycan/xylan/chitin deacetylase (PgdA/CDA1 family)